MERISRIAAINMSFIASKPLEEIGWSKASEAWWDSNPRPQMPFGKRALPLSYDASPAHRPPARTMTSADERPVPGNEGSRKFMLQVNAPSRPGIRSNKWLADGSCSLCRSDDEPRNPALVDHRPVFRHRRPGMARQ